MNSRCKEAPNTISGYSGKIKSNQHVFQSNNPNNQKGDKQYIMQSSNATISPLKGLKKKTEPQMIPQQ